MKFKFTIYYFLLALCAACTSTSPSPVVAPAPIAEVPNLRFPQEVGGEFDLSTAIGSGSGGSAMKFLVMEGDDISHEISDSANNSVFFLSLVDQILASLHDLIIPIREDVTSFTDVIILGDQLMRVDIDFRHYENSQGLQCSGHTGATPICYRIWFNGRRALSGVFINTIPTLDNPGDGFIQGLSTVKIFDVFPFAMAGTYDLRDPNLKSAKFFIAAILDDDPFLEDMPESDAEFDATIHLNIDQVGPPESALKSVNASVRNPDESDDMKRRHIAQWREGEDLWSGTIDRAPLDDFSLIGEFFAACARISTGLVVNSSLCETANIDVSGIGFLPFLEIGDIAFPEDFPLEPPPSEGS